MNASSGQELGLQAVVETWLRSLPPILLEPREGGVLLLDVQVLKLAGSRAHPDFLVALLASPERVRQAVAAALSAADLLAPGQRVWLRPRQLPAAAELGVPAALECLRCAPDTLMACHGVCVAATALFQQPASRSFQCTVCSKICTLHSLEPPPPCCGGEVAEVEQARVMVPGQVVFLASDAPLPGSPSTQLGANLLAVHLADDLAGRVRVGDQVGAGLLMSAAAGGTYNFTVEVLATGSGRNCGARASLMVPQAYLPVTMSVLMEACNVAVLARAVLTHHTSELGAAACSHLAALAASKASSGADSGGGLEALLGLLDSALPVAASPLLKVSMLLSAAAAGTGSTQLEAAAAQEDAEPQAVLRRRAATTRNQVNVMLAAAAPEPHIQRFLHAAAATLCEHSVVASPADPRCLLPALDSKYVDPALGVAVPLLVGGQLAEAGGGVLLLSSSTLDTKRSIALGQFMAASEAVLHPGCPELCMPVGATLWTMMHEQDLSKTGCCGPPPTASMAGGGLSLTERIINRFSHPFFCQHDILLWAGAETEDDVDEMMASILMGRAGLSSGDASALRALQHHLQCSRAAAQPSVSPKAAALLSAYFLHLREFEGAQQAALASLARVAAASARLRHSPVIEALPDAALAVALLEEKLLTAGAAPNFWPRWRDELQRCTPLGECLRGMAEDATAALCVGAGGGCAGGGNGAAGGEEDAWMAEE